MPHREAEPREAEPREAEPREAEPRRGGAKVFEHHTPLNPAALAPLIFERLSSKNKIFEGESIFNLC